MAWPQEGEKPPGLGSPHPTLPTRFEALHLQAFISFTFHHILGKVKGETGTERTVTPRDNRAAATRPRPSLCSLPLTLDMPSHRAALRASVHSQKHGRQGPVGWRVGVGTGNSQQTGARGLAGQPELTALGQGAWHSWLSDFPKRKTQV